jgi:aminoglycoside 6'-N-acetyltransferase I
MTEHTYSRAMASVTVSPAGISLSECDVADLDDWARLRAELWPEDTFDEHLRFAAASLGDPTRLIAFVARDDADRTLGFAEASLRFDYVNGCASSPVAFLEGLYVRPEVRRHGIARGLVAAVEQWGRERGCTELASDALLENDVSHNTHRGIGFVETERVVYFLKSLETPVTQ